MQKTQLPITRRLRRLRQNPGARDLVQETWLHPSDFIQPLFVMEGKGTFEPIESMPGQYRFTLDALIKECEQLAELNIAAINIFPYIDPKLKDPVGSEALNPDNITFKAITAIRKAVPELMIMTDIALDPYTSHGHDGVFNKNGTDIDNDCTVARLADMACLAAEAGAHMVAPSDMMDGRVFAIRQSLDELGLTDIAIIAYSAKFHSCYYGPFREAVGSMKAAGTHLLNKRTYQLNPANTREALLEVALDEEEGADIVMVKPAGLYLDIIRQVRDNTALPVAAYQVSGEYAQIHAAAKLGWLNLEAARDESLLAIKRAGADMILTYFAKDMARVLQAGQMSL